MTSLSKAETETSINNLGKYHMNNFLTFKTICIYIFRSDYLHVADSVFIFVLYIFILLSACYSFVYFFTNLFFNYQSKKDS